MVGWVGLFDQKPVIMPPRYIRQAGMAGRAQSATCLLLYKEQEWSHIIKLHAISTVCFVFVGLKPFRFPRTIAELWDVGQRVTVVL